MKSKGGRGGGQNTRVEQQVLFFRRAKHFSCLFSFACPLSPLCPLHAARRGTRRPSGARGGGECGESGGGRERPRGDGAWRKKGRRAAGRGRLRPPRSLPTHSHTRTLHTHRLPPAAAAPPPCAARVSCFCVTFDGARRAVCALSRLLPASARPPATPLLRGKRSLTSCSAEWGSGMDVAREWTTCENGCQPFASPYPPPQLRPRPPCRRWRPGKGRDERGYVRLCV